MSAPDPTLEEYLQIARIYTSGNLSDVQLLDLAKKHQAEDYYRTITMGFQSYLRRGLNVPLMYWPEICKLGRPLSALELEALHLKGKVEKEQTASVRISIDGLE